MWSPCQKESTGRTRSGKRKSLKRNKKRKKKENPRDSHKQEIINVKL